MSSCQLFEWGGEISAFREMNVRYFIQIIDDAPLSEKIVYQLLAFAYASDANRSTNT